MLALASFWLAANFVRAPVALETTGQVYRSISPEEMLQLLTSHGMKAVLTNDHGEDTIYVNSSFPFEMRFLICHDEPNPCGYSLRLKYVGLALTPGQLNSVNQRLGFARAYSPSGTKDVFVDYDVYAHPGVTASYIRSSMGLLLGISDVFEGKLEEMHIPSNRVRRGP